MPERLDKHILKNKMVILGEPIAGAASAAFCFRLPAGAATLPQGCAGAGNVITDWILRGAGDKTSKQLIDALDGLGLHRSGSVGSSHITLTAALEAGNLAKALDLYADIILRPGLHEDQFELSKQLAIQELLSLDDDPRQKVMLSLREQFYPPPLGKSPLGTADELNALTAAKCAGIIHQKFDVSNSIFAVAGKYDFDTVCKQLETLFQDHDLPRRACGTAGKKRPCDVTGPQSRELPVRGPSDSERPGRYQHEHHQGAQVHIGLMTETVPIRDADHYNAMGAVSVLSGGMSARLFTQVREKRGLCYAVGARYHTLKDTAGIACYAGTTPEKAQQTLDVIIKEFKRLDQGISQEEINRAKVGLKSMLILQSESSTSRAIAATSDYYLIGRVRSLDEIKNRIEQITVDSVLNFLRNNKFKEFTVVTIGPKQLNIQK